MSTQETNLQPRLVEPPSQSTTPPPPAPGTPVRVKTEYETTAPPLSVRAPSLPPNRPGSGYPFQARHEDAIRRINEFASDPERARAFHVHVIRKGPRTYKTASGQTVPIPCVELGQMPIDTYENLRASIEEEHGGGRYGVTVLDGQGFGIYHLEIPIPVESFPPRLKGVEVGVSTNGNGHALTGTPASAPLSREEAEIAREITRLRLEGDRRRQELEVRRQENALREEQVRVDNLELARLDLRGSKKDDPAVEKRFDAMMEMIRDQNRRMEAFMEKMSQRPDNSKSIVDAITAILPPLLAKPDNGASAIIEAAKFQAEGAKEIAKAHAESNAKIMQTMLELQKDKKDPKDSDFQRSMLQMIFEHKLNAPQDSVKTILDAMNMGREQAMDLYERLEGRGGGPEFDAQSPGASLVNVLVDMFRKRQGGVVAMPGAPGALNEAQLRAVAAQVTNTIRAELRQMAGLPAQAQAALPMQSQATGPTFETPAGGAGTTNPPSNTNAPAPSVSAPPPVLTPPPAPVPNVDAITGETSEQRLHDHLNETLRLMLADLQDGRLVHQWPQYALENLNKEFLDALAASPDDGARLALIEARVDPALYAQVKALVAARMPDGYRNLLSALNSLIEEHRATSAEGPQ